MAVKLVELGRSYRHSGPLTREIQQKIRDEHGVLIQNVGERVPIELSGVFDDDYFFDVELLPNGAKVITTSPIDGKEVLTVDLDEVTKEFFLALSSQGIGYIVAYVQYLTESTRTRK